MKPTIITTIESRVFVPSVNGDVCLERHAEHPKQTVVKLTKLTETERQHMADVLKKFKVVDPKDTLKDKIADALLREDMEFTLKAPLEKVHAFLVKKMKGGRLTITAVKLTDGTLTEVREPGKQLPKGDMVTTEIPARGCPMPVFDPREVRANRVMRRFLNAQQIADFDHTGAVCVVGGETGHRYRVCHRNSRLLESPLVMALVTDLDRRRPVCCEISNLPPSEEVLAIVVALNCREREWVSSNSPHHWH